jgi:FlaA1/EpsC-like NDP-sugar epimerase
MRPGEKLFEELLTAEEGTTATANERIFVAKPTDLNTSLIEETLRGFVQGNLPQGEKEVEAFIQRFLPEFKVVRPGSAPAAVDAGVSQAAAAVETGSEDGHK